MHCRYPTGEYFYLYVQPTSIAKSRQVGFHQYMAFEESFTMEPLVLAPGIELASTTRSIESSKDETVAIHVEDAISQKEQGLAWLKLSSDVHREDPAIEEIHPALRDETETTEDGKDRGLPQQEIEPKRLSDEASQVSSQTAYHDVPEGTTHSRESVPKEPTDAFASALDSLSSEHSDTDSVNVDPPEIPLRSLTMSEASKHNKLHDMWLVINNQVYDVTQFQHRHPGGPKILYGVAGKDATKKFDKYHRRAILESYNPIFRIGVIGKDSISSAPRKGLFSKMGIVRKKT